MPEYQQCRYLVTSKPLKSMIFAYVLWCKVCLDRTKGMAHFFRHLHFYYWHQYCYLFLNWSLTLYHLVSSHYHLLNSVHCLPEIVILSVHSLFPYSFSLDYCNTHLALTPYLSNLSHTFTRFKLLNCGSDFQLRNLYWSLPPNEKIPI